MNSDQKQTIITTVIEREHVRSLGRAVRLFRYPFRTFPFYVLAVLGHIKPILVSFKTLWGTPMTCYFPEGNTFYYYGYCEANVTNFFLRYIKEGMMCVDVGAHVGFYSMLLSELVGARGSVHSFEPTPWTYTLLKKNTEELHNVTINNVAVAQEAKTITFTDYGLGYGAYNSAHEKGAAGLDRKSVETVVSSVSIDTYCKEASINPDIVKIDVEGFEYEVLSGMKHVLSQGNAPRPFVTIEVAGGDTWAANRNASFDLMAQCHYVACEITLDGFLKKHVLQDSYTYDNLLFVPQERLPELNEFFV